LWLAGASAAAAFAPLFGCSSSAAENGGANRSDCTAIPEETAGPYPGDGSNGPNALTASGIVRSDITQSFGTLSGTAAGVPLTVTLKIVNASGSCESLAGYAVYIWHCDQNGLYSLYTAADQNYLRGVQETDSDGTVTFTSIYPACYPGRWPHIHFEVYKSLAEATSAGSKVATSQLALPDAQNQEAYASAGYEASVTAYAMVSLATDTVFSDGATSETPTMTGSTSTGYVASLTLAVAG
jgi:protocatechuate 3,4-dioxygenase beta subunit